MACGQETLHRGSAQSQESHLNFIHYHHRIFTSALWGAAAAPLPPFPAAHVTVTATEPVKCAVN